MNLSIRIMIRIEGQRANSHVYSWNNYTYHLDSRYKETPYKYYRCTSRKATCNCYVFCDDTGKLTIINKHTHAPPDITFDGRKFNHELVVLARTTFLSPEEIIDQASQKYPGCAEHVSTMSMRMKISRERQKRFPPVPKTLEGLGDILTNYPPFEDIYRGRVTDRDGKSALLFASQEMLDFVKVAKELHIDATFAVVPRRPVAAQLWIVFLRIRDKATFRKWKELQLTRAPKELLHLTWGLPMLPPDRIAEGIQALTTVSDVEAYAAFPKITNFITYLRRQWLPLANVVSVQGSPIRTNNVAEAFNRRSTIKLGGSHPALYTFLHKLQNEIYSQNTKLERLLERKGNGVSKNIPKVWFQYEKKLKITESMLECGRYDIKEFLSEVTSHDQSKDIESRARLLRPDGERGHELPIAAEMNDPPNVYASLPADLTEMRVPRSGPRRRWGSDTVSKNSRGKVNDGDGEYYVSDDEDDLLEPQFDQSIGAKVNEDTIALIDEGSRNDSYDRIEHRQLISESSDEDDLIEIQHDDSIRSKVDEHDARAVEDSGRTKKNTVKRIKPQALAARSDAKDDSTFKDKHLVMCKQLHLHPKSTDPQPRVARTDRCFSSDTESLAENEQMGDNQSISDESIDERIRYMLENPIILPVLDDKSDDSNGPSMSNSEIWRACFPNIPANSAIQGSIDDNMGDRSDENKRTFPTVPIDDDEIPNKIPKTVSFSHDSDVFRWLFPDAMIPEVIRTDRVDAESVESVILPNGLKSDHFIKIDGRVYKAINTCAFDSLVHVIMTSALDYPDYAARVKESKNRLLRFVWELIDTGITPNLLDERLHFLLKTYPITPGMDDKRGSVVVHTINALDSIGNTVKNTLESEPSGFRTMECSHCGPWKYSNAYISPNYDTVVEKGFGALVEALKSAPVVSNIKCPRKYCPGTYKLTLEMNFHLFVELDIRTHASGPQSLRAQLKELPEEIKLQGQKYRITGIVGFGSGHFISYCRRFGGQWHIYNDMCSKVTVCRDDTEIEPHLAVYIRQTKEAQSSASIGA